MRLFLDANVMTYLAIFEEFVTEGTPAAFRSDIAVWRALQRTEVDPKLLRELLALRVLYVIDDSAHFDWLFSDVAAAEISRIRDVLKRGAHFGLLNRLVEHRTDVFAEEGIHVEPEERERAANDLFSEIPRRMMSDVYQFAEACMVEADYFVTNDGDLIRLPTRTEPAARRVRPSDLPFVAKEMMHAKTQNWVSEVKEEIYQTRPG